MLREVARCWTREHRARRDPEDDGDVIRMPPIAQGVYCLVCWAESEGKCMPNTPRRVRHLPTERETF